MTDTPSTPEPQTRGAGASGRKRRVRVVLYRDAARRWRYKVIAANGRTADAGEQGFRRKGYARKRGIAAARGLYPDVEVVVEEQLD